MGMQTKTIPGPVLEFPPEPQAWMNPILTPESAAVFASSWLAAWNARDLDRILNHYADDIEFISPFVRRLLNCKRDGVYGIVALRAYFARALNAYPDLQFVLRRAYCGVQSVVLEYESVSGLLAGEVMEFNDVGLMCRVRAHYAAEIHRPA